MTIIIIIRKIQYGGSAVNYHPSNRYQVIPI